MSLEYYDDIYGDTYLANPRSRTELAQFIRFGNNLSLLIGLGRIGGGFDSVDAASSVFMTPPSATVRDDLDAIVAAAWAANKAADQTTLQTAIDAALTDTGYLAPDGTAL